MIGNAARTGPGSGDFDVVVVGGGHNGLICAAYLARAGVKTLLVEARDTLGGCASTVSDLGARFNICSCDHTLVRAMPFIDDLDLSSHGLRYLESDPATVYLGHDPAPPWLFFNDSERTIESIARHRPAQAAAYRRYLADALPVAQLVLAIGTGPASTRPMLRRVLARRGRGATRLLQWSRASALDVLKQYFDDEALVMPAVSNGPSVWGVSAELPGTGLAAAQYALRHNVKTGRPVGGSGALIDALEASFTAAGGTLRFGTAVTGLLAEADKVHGVRLADGTEITATAVVTACDPALVLGQWLDAPAAPRRLTPRRLTRRHLAPRRLAARSLARRSVSRARSQPRRDGYQSKIDAVITDVPRYRALEEAGLDDLFEGRDRNEPNYVVSPPWREVAEAHRLRADGQIAQRPTFMVNVPSVLDPAMRSSDGHHVMSFETLFTPYELNGGWDDSPEPDRWLQVWSRLVQPGFLSHIDRYRTMTPVRYEREFFLDRGYTPSYAGSPLATLLGRKRELSRHRAPVDGLFLSGAGTFPGAGVWGAAGRNAADAVLRSLR